VTEFGLESKSNGDEEVSETLTKRTESLGRPSSSLVPFVNRREVQPVIRPPSPLTTSSDLVVHVRSLGNTKLRECLQLLDWNDASLTFFDLDNDDIDDVGATALARALQVNKSLTVVSLNGNKIGDKGAAELAKVLRVKTPLQELYLHGNKIGDVGATTLAKALQFNNCLAVIDLQDNNIGDEGTMRLLETLENHNGTLVELSLSHGYKVTLMNL
jgi:Ran GTPase-activating protein (RanGAP) involved in mRNA processing and transport